MRIGGCAHLSFRPARRSFGPAATSGDGAAPEVAAGAAGEAPGGRRDVAGACANAVYMDRWGASSHNLSIWTAPLRFARYMDREGHRSI